VLYNYFRSEKRKVPHLRITPVKSWFPLVMVAAAVILLSLASTFDPHFTWFGGIATVITGAVSYLYVRVRRFHHQIEEQHRFDWETVIFLAGVFILVHMLEKQGVISSLVSRFGILEGAHPFLVLTAVVWFSVAVSAFIDNVPYIAAMFPVVHGMAGNLQIPHEMLFLGVLIGSCVGGNITPIGAAANLTAIGILRREGRPVSFGSFVRIGLPFTLAATTASYLLLYLLYRP
jgi:Na+/H+ antiporter NhaD/arsenite permease-like protein